VNEVQNHRDGTASAVSSASAALNSGEKPIRRGATQTSCELFLDEPADGAWNMAVDEALLESAVDGDGPYLRIYAWQRPTLSIGYFQKYAQAQQWLDAAGEPNVPVVRRPSGGGAILHDQEITYALILPRDCLPALRRPMLYRLVHDGLGAGLRRWGIAAQVRETSATVPPDTQHLDEPFLCFLRSANGDLLFDGCKAGGSAQRRRAGAVLQHGSLILAPSPLVPEIRGLALHETHDRSGAELVPRLADAVAARLGLNLLPGCISPAQRACAKALVRNKFASAQWTQRR
jgi:lipoate-protein ligase A